MHAHVYVSEKMPAIGILLKFIIEAAQMMHFVQ